MTTQRIFANAVLAPLAALILLLGVAPQDGHAQVAFGVQGNWGSESDLGVGARALVNIAGSNFEAVGSIDRFFPENNLDWWDFNANLMYHFHIQPSLLPYLGGGLNVARLSNDNVSDSKAGLNVAGGLRFPGNLTPFVELRAVVSGRDQLVLTGGVLFGPTLFR
jgi:opacity protein-like surface antigen